MELIKDSVKANREQFVSGLNGTTLGEVTVGASLGPILLLLRGLLWGVLPTFLRQKSLFRYMFDITVLVLPFIFALTVMSDFLPHMFVTLSFTALTLTCILVNLTGYEEDVTNTKVHGDNKQARINKKRKPKHTPYKDAFLSSNKVPFVTSIIHMVHIFTMISILAVDFNIFPRRFAKTETFGCSVMDLGVGAFVFVNGLVSTYARRNWKGTTPAPDSHTWRNFIVQLTSSFPLFVLGVLRFVSVRGTGYQHHVSEYGVHWNFFFTLVFVKVFSDIILFYVEVKRLVLFSGVLLTLYQFLLSSTYYNLTSMLLSNDDRVGIILQNKEGLFSCVGFLCIYLTGIAYGSLIFKVRSCPRDWYYICVKLLVFNCLSWTCLYLCMNYVQHISRRMANSAYVIWVVSHCSYLLLCFLIVDLAVSYLIFSQKLPPSSMPNQWILSTSVKSDKSKSFLKSLCLMTAVNRNQLFIFLLSNVLTGLVNFSVDTLEANESYSFLIVFSYSFTILSITWVLHTKQITVKFW